MAKLTIYVPDDLAEQVKAADLTVSPLAQEALRAELDRQAHAPERIAALVAAFRDAQEAWQRAWKDGDDADAHLRAAAERDAVQHAAVDLVAAAAHRHTIEDEARVYLVLSPEGWTLPSTQYDGMGFGGLTGGVDRDQCECDTPDECAAVADAAAYIPRPNGPQLAALVHGVEVLPEYATHR